jgi:hypothetical protein
MPSPSGEDGQLQPNGGRKVRSPAQMIDRASHDCSLFTPRLTSGQLIRTLRSRRLFVTTLTELNAMAALARIGLSRIPKAG